MNTKLLHPCVTWLLALLLIISVSHATPYVWTGDGGDDLFSNPANWDQPTAPPPGGGAEVFFPTSGTHLVILDEDTVVDYTRFFAISSPVTEDPGHLTMNLDGNTYTVTNSTSESLTQIFLQGGDGTRTLTVLNGTMGFSGTMTLVNNNNAGARSGDGVIQVRDGATMKFGGVTSIGNANLAAKATVLVDQGSLIHAEDRFRIAQGSDFEVEMDITGPGSQFLSTATHSSRSAVYIGESGEATVNVSAGGSMVSTTNTSFSLGLNASATADVTIAGSAFNPVTEQVDHSLFSARYVFVGGGRFLNNAVPEAGGDAILTFGPQGVGQIREMIVFHNATAETSGTLAINNGQLNITDSLLLSEGSTFRFTLNESLPDFDVGLFVMNEDPGIDAELTIDNATLKLFVDPSFTPILNETYLIGSYDILSGAFAGLGEGATVFDESESYAFILSYVDGIDGHSITLTMIPEPRHAALILVCCVLVAVVVRRHRRP